MKFSKISFGLLLAIILVVNSLDCGGHSHVCESFSTKHDFILDTDLGNCTDDILAIHAAFYYQAQGKCNIKGIMQSRKLIQCKELLDRFMHYYKADSVPIGFADGDEHSQIFIPYYKLVDKKNADGSYFFPRTGIKLEDRLPSWKLYRKLLSEAEDNSITIVCFGLFTNLGMLIDSGGDEYSSLDGLSLIAKKVKVLNLMGGCFVESCPQFPELDGHAVEYNILGDVPMAKKVIERWPTSICILPGENALDFPSVHEEVLADYSNAKDGFMYQTYANFSKSQIGDGQYWWDPLTVIHAVLGEGNYFDCSEQGKISISSSGVTNFSAQKDGNAHIIKIRSDSIARFYDLLRSYSVWSPNN